MSNILASIPEFLKKFILFISSYIPLFIFLIISSLDFKQNVVNQLWKMKTYFIVIIAVVIVSIRIVCYSKKKSNIQLCGGKYYKSIEKTGDNVISYLMTYLVPLITTVQNNTLDYNNLLINGFLFFLIGVVYIKQDLTYLNPLLNCLGFNVYKIKRHEHYIISKLSIREIKYIEIYLDEDETNKLNLYKVTDTTSYLKIKK